MKKYLLIVLLVSVCFGQMKVYSEVPMPDTIKFSFEEERTFYYPEKKLVTLKKNVIINGTWLCVNVSGCDLSISWEYIDGEKSNEGTNIKIGSSVIISDILELINGIKSLNRYSFKKYDVKAEYQLQNAKLVYDKNKFLELKNSGTGRLKIIEPETFIVGLENWMSQKPK